MLTVVYLFLFQETDEKPKEILETPDNKPDQTKTEEETETPVVVKEENKMSAKTESKEETIVSKPFYYKYFFYRSSIW